MQKARHSSSAPRGRRRTQDERSAETQQKLITSAISCICKFGFANATTAEIAAHAGVSRGALQHHFGTRFDLLVAVIDYLSHEMLGLAKILPESDQSVDHRIDAIIQQYWKVYTSRTFLAVLNIFLGVKNNKKQYALLQRHMRKFYDMNDVMWLEIFSDVRLPEERLLSARRILFGALRGLAIAQIHGTQPKAMQTEFNSLRKMFVAAFFAEAACSRSAASADECAAEIAP